MTKTRNTQQIKESIPKNNDKLDQVKDIKKKRPKRAPSIIFAEYGFPDDFPPTLAQFIDQIVDDKEREQNVQQYLMMGIDAAWKVEESRQRVLLKFPRAFDDDLTEEEMSYVRMLLDIENPEPLLSTSTLLLLAIFIVVAIFIFIYYYFVLNVNLFYYLHLALLSLMSPRRIDTKTSIQHTQTQNISINTNETKTPFGNNNNNNNIHDPTSVYGFKFIRHETPGNPAVVFRVQEPTFFEVLLNPSKHEFYQSAKNYTAILNNQQSNTQNGNTTADNNVIVENETHGKDEL